MHDILIPTRNSRAWDTGVEYGTRLAALLDGSVTAIYNVPPAIVIPDIALPGVAAEIMDICREETAAALRAQDPFERWTREIGARSGSWRVAEGVESAVLQSAAKWADLLVLEHSNESTRKASVGELGRAVLGVDVPCIIVPANIAVPRLDRIAVAWKGTAESIRALHAALPLLQRAKQVTLVYGERGTASDASASSMELAQKHLQDHAVSATLKRIDPESSAAGAAILAAAMETLSDMLVMGAYGRTRFSEWVFGGATRHVLEFAQIPVFMRH